MVYRASVILGAVTLLMGFSYVWGEEPIELTVMSYNIGGASESVSLEEKDIAALAQQIKDEKADFVGMQEVDLATTRRSGRDFVSEIGVALAKIGYPMHHYYSPTHVYPGGWMVLCLWSRFPIVDSGYAVNFPIGSDRWKTIGIVVEPKPGTRVNVFTTHYFIGGPDLPKHKEQTDSVLSFASKFAGPRILTGDFNFTPDKPFFKQITDAGYKESCEAVGGGHRATVGLSSSSPYQIDYIFATPDVEFVGTHVPTQTISDHWPIVARVRIKGKSD